MFQNEVDERFYKQQELNQDTELVVKVNKEKQNKLVKDNREKEDGSKNVDDDNKLMKCLKSSVGKIS